MIPIIVFALAGVAIIIVTVLEITHYKDIKSRFYCSNCGEFMQVISNNTKCNKCNRWVKVKEGNWDHGIIPIKSCIKVHNKTEEFRWKDFRKIEITELIINICAIGILLAAIIAEAHILIK